MPKKIWFTRDASDQLEVAVITDDFHVEINRLGTVTIYGWEGTSIRLDLDDTADMAEVLGEAAKILRSRGFTTAVKPPDRT